MKLIKLIKLIKPKSSTDARNRLNLFNLFNQFNLPSCRGTQLSMNHSQSLRPLIPASRVEPVGVLSLSVRSSPVFTTGCSWERRDEMMCSRLGRGRACPAHFIGVRQALPLQKTTRTSGTVESNEPGSFPIRTIYTKYLNIKILRYFLVFPGSVIFQRLRRPDAVRRLLGLPAYLRAFHYLKSTSPSQAPRKNPGSRTGPGGG